MKDVLLAEWTGLLERIKARFSRADFDELNQQIRAVLIELAAEANIGGDKPGLRIRVNKARHRCGK